MWFSVGSSSSLIDGMGQVGMSSAVVDYLTRFARRLTDRLQLPPDDKQRRGVEDRAVRARYDSDQQGQRETLQRLSTGDEDRTQDQDDREAGDDRPRGGLHDAQVHDLLERQPLADPQVFADSVEDDD